LLCARVVDVLSGVPVVILLLGDGDYLPGGKAEVVLMARDVVIQGLDFERHGDAARGQQRSQSRESREGGWVEAVAGLGKLKLPSQESPQSAGRMTTARTEACVDKIGKRKQSKLLRGMELARVSGGEMEMDPNL
jgi:hypothetical protein